jgi:hypothetical protein
MYQKNTTVVFQMIYDDHNNSNIIWKMVIII